MHAQGPIEALNVSGPHDGDVTVEGIKFIVTQSTILEDETGNDITLNDFAVGEEVDAWGPTPVNNETTARKIRKR
ncbi:MAG: hypothetical protein D6813_01995 [Calditrichaeota bacterium]|nr:MAG: hypothetical protein D6813_01995 [Calditrichota bacterium]